MPILEQLLEQYPDKVKVIFKNFPLRSHQYAYKAATAALAAHAQGKFWEFHDRLFQNYRQLNDQKIDQVAEELGLDMAAFKKDQASARVREMIQRDLQDVKALGVRGTPSVYINGRLQKRRSLDGFKMSIEAELQRLAADQ